MTLDGLHAAAGTIVGQNLGVDNVPRAEKTAKAASALGSLFMLVLTILAFAYPEQIIGFFSDVPEVQELGRISLYALMPGLICTGISFGIGSVFTGSGYNLPWLISGVLSRWLAQLPFLYLAVRVMQWPFFCVSLSFPWPSSLNSSMCFISTGKANGALGVYM